MTVQIQKLKTLYLMKILFYETDENHIMTAQDLSAALESRYGISSERKSIYNDIETLQEFGLDIIHQKGSNQGYYVASRDFELPELKLLVDAVQSSKFITIKKSETLIKKLKKLASISESEQLQRQVFILNRPKTINETIYYNVDKIHTAISKCHKIEFQYNEWTVSKKLQPKREGNLYEVSPWALTWDDENYYLIAYDESSGTIKHYRVDKMHNARTTSIKRIGETEFKSFDLVDFSKKTFSMYGGKDEQIRLLCHNSIVGVIIDRFGSDPMFAPYENDGDYFTVNLTVAVSRQFFGWLTGIGSNIQILAPEHIRLEYKNYLSSILAESL